MALTASEALNYEIWDRQFPAVTYLNGLFLFVAGVSILQKEHRWTRRWPVLITILGWIATLGGLARLFAPKAQQLAGSAGMYVFLTAGFVVGCFSRTRRTGLGTRAENTTGSGATTALSDEVPLL